MSFPQGMTSLVNLYLQPSAGLQLTGYPSFEICLYNDSQSLINWNNFLNEQIVVFCSQWSFQMNVSDPVSYPRILSPSDSSNYAIIDFLSPSVTIFSVLVPDATSIISWNMTNWIFLEQLMLGFSNPCFWPSANNTLLPVNLNQLSLFGNLQSLPQNVWQLANLTDLNIDVHQLFQFPTWITSNVAPYLASFYLSYLNASDYSSFPDLSIYSPKLNYFAFNANFAQSPLLPPLSPFPLTYIGIYVSLQLDNFVGIQDSQWDWLSSWNQLTSFRLVMNQATFVCNNCTIGGFEHFYLQAPLVTSLPNTLFNSSANYLVIEITAFIKDWIFGNLLLPSLISLQLTGTDLGSATAANTLDSICTNYYSISTLQIVNSTLTKSPSFFNCTAITSVIISSSQLDISTFPNATQTFPSITNIDLSYNGLTYLPSTLCSLRSVQLTFTGNSISQIMPCPLNFAGHPASSDIYLDSNSLTDWNAIVNVSTWSSIIAQLNLASNQLGQSPNPPPTNLISLHFSSLTELDVSNNNIAAPLSQDPWFTMFRKIITINMSNNQFYGSLNSSNYIPLSAQSTIDLSYNQISGNLSLSLLCNSMTAGAFLINGNQISGWTDLEGDTTSDWCPTSPLAVLDIGENQFSWIPDTNFSQIKQWTEFRMGGNRNFQGQPLPSFLTEANLMAFLNFSSCGFSDTLEDKPWLNVSSYVDFSNNNLYGTVPPAIWKSFYNLNLSRNSFTGSIPGYWSNTWAARVAPAAILGSSFVDLSYNNFYGNIPDTIGWFLYSNMDASNNPYLTGPPPLIQNTLFCMKQPSGCIPHSYSFANNANMDFCSYHNYTNFNNPLISCDFIGTNACNCPQLYPQCSMSCTAPPQQPTDSCIGNQPSSSFLCINGVWVSQGSVSVPTLTVGGPSQINGSLTVSSSITFTGISSSSSPQGGNGGNSSPLLTISQCLVVESSGEFVIEFQLDQNDVNHIYSQSGHQSSVVVIQQQSDNCTTDLSSILFKVSSPSGCKKLKTSNQSTTNSLVVLFTVDSFNCDTWWIALVSVLGGLLLFGLVVFLVIYAKSPSLRAIINPFSVRNKLHEGRDGI